MPDAGVPAAISTAQQLVRMLEARGVTHASGLEAMLHTTTELHLVLPENAAFLAADLSSDPAADLAKAEGGSRRL